jgi:hypothetical protein
MSFETLTKARAHCTEGIDKTAFPSSWACSPQLISSRQLSCYKGSSTINRSQSYADEYYASSLENPRPNLPTIFLPEHAHHIILLLNIWLTIEPHLIQPPLLQNWKKFSQMRIWTTTGCGILRHLRRILTLGILTREKFGCPIICKTSRFFQLNVRSLQLPGE